MILQRSPIHTDSLISTHKEEYFIERHSPHFPLQGFPETSTFVPQITFQPSQMLNTMSENIGVSQDGPSVLDSRAMLHDEPRRITGSTKPIDILFPPGAQRHWNTAPSEFHFPQSWEPTRPRAAAQPKADVDASEEEARVETVVSRTVTTKRNGPAVKHVISKAQPVRNDLNAYRERILSEARRRMNEAEQRIQATESDKENIQIKLDDCVPAAKTRKRLNSDFSGGHFETTNGCYDGFEGTSAKDFTHGNSITCLLNDGLTSCDEDADITDDYKVMNAGNFWDDESLMPTKFTSIGDIIGYAKVVRAQRDETLMSLDTVIGQFSHAWSIMRKDMETAVKNRCKNPSCSEE
ncbi:hypothetical protein Ddc_03266 [Ditylenchus destructor]|nr:hypothetical protein Ddc_03266 [Ditylenchus destructor]